MGGVSSGIILMLGTFYHDRMRHQGVYMWPLQLTTMIHIGKADEEYLYILSKPPFLSSLVPIHHHHL